jgi:hypothetical protein
VPFVDEANLSADDEYKIADRNAEIFNGVGLWAGAPIGSDSSCFQAATVGVARGVSCSTML